MKAWKCYTVPFTDRDGRRALQCVIYIPFTNSKVLHCVIMLIYICLPTEKLQSRWCSAWYLLLPNTDNREEGRRVLHCIMYASYQQRCRKKWVVWCITSLSTQQTTQQSATLYNVSSLLTEKQESGWYNVLHLSTQQSATLCNVSPKLPTEKQESGWYSVLHLSLYPTECYTV